MSATSVASTHSSPRTHSTSSGDSPHKEEKEIPLPNVELSPHVRYAEEALRRHLIDSEGNLITAPSNLLFDANDLERLGHYCLQPRPFHGNGWTVSWSLHQFFNYLIPYISQSPIQGRVEMVQGSHRAMGRPFWEKNLRYQVGDEMVDHFVTEEMWRFCTENPRCIALSCYSPTMKPLEQSHQILHALVLYAMAVQAFPVGTHSLQEAPGILTHWLRQEQNHLDAKQQSLKEVMQEFEKSSQVFYQKTSDGSVRASKIHLHFPDGIDLMITFSSEPMRFSTFQLDDFRIGIECEEADLIYQLHPSQGSSSLHDLLIHRLDPSFHGNSGEELAHALGDYLAHLTQVGGVYRRQDTENLLAELLKRSGDIQNLLLLAMEAGRSKLPPSREALVTYYGNLTDFLHFHQIDRELFPPIPWDTEERIDHPLLALVKETCERPTAAWRESLAVASLLQAGLSSRGPLPRCYRNGGDEVEIRFPHGSLVLRGDLTASVVQIQAAGDEGVHTFSRVLEACAPIDEGIMREREFRGDLPLPLLEVYHQLREDKRYTQAAQTLFFILIRGGWKPAHPNDLQLRYILEAQGRGSLKRVLNQLASAYQESNLSPHIASMRDQLLAFDEPTPNECCIAIARVFVQLPKASPVWKVFSEVHASPQEECNFLLDAIATLPPFSLPFALSRTAFLCKEESKELTAEEKFRLINRSLDRLAEMQTEPFHASYEPKLKALLTQIAESALVGGVDLTRLKRFAEVWNRLAPHLFQNGKLLPILAKLKIHRTDKLFYPWMVKCLEERFSSDEASLEELLSVFATFRQTGADNHPQTDRSLLLRVLHTLIDRLVERRFPPDAPTHRELTPLIARLQPTAQEIPRLRDYLLLFYHQLLDQGASSPLIDDLTKHLPYFITSCDLRISSVIESLTAALQRTPRDDSLWNKFATLFELIREEPLLLETNIQMLEKLSAEPFISQLSLKSPIFRCFKSGLGKAAATLSETQRQRLISTYIRVTLHAIQHDGNGEARDSLAHLVSLAQGAIKAFFERCQADHKRGGQKERLRQVLRNFLESGALPEAKKSEAAAPPSRRPVPAASGPVLTRKVKPLTFATPKDLQTYLERLPPNDYERWTACLQFIPHQELFLTVAWNCWLRAHPVATFPPEDGVHWLPVAEKCLSLKAMMAVLEQFLKNIVPTFFKRVGPADRLAMLSLCLKISISHAWEETSERELKLFSLLLDLFFDDAFLDELGDIWNLLDGQNAARLALLLVKVPTDTAYFKGHLYFMSLIATIGYESRYQHEDNLILFRCFCERPYTPAGEEELIILRAWIDKSWQAHRRELTPLQVIILIKALCQFEHPSKIMEVWSAFVTGSWAAAESKEGEFPPIIRLPNPNLTLSRFFEATFALMDRVVSWIPIISEKVGHLIDIHDRVVYYTQGVVKEIAHPLLIFHFKWATHALGIPDWNDPVVDKAVLRALQSMGKYLPYVKQEGPVGKNAIAAFNKALPAIIGISDRAAEALPAAARAIETIRKLDWIVFANSNEDSSWLILLYSLAEGVRKAPPPCRRNGALFALQIFKESTHSDLIRETMGPIMGEVAQNRFIPSLAYLFLTIPQLDFLTSDEFRGLFGGLSSAQCDAVGELLTKDLVTESLKQRLETSLALSRLLEFTEKKSDFLRIMTYTSVLNPLAIIPTFDPIALVDLQMWVRVRWILVCQTFLEDEPIRDQKLEIAHEMLTQIIPVMATEANYRVYKRYLLDIVRNDREVAVIVRQTLESHGTQFDNLIQFLGLNLEAAAPPLALTLDAGGPPLALNPEAEEPPSGGSS